MCLKIIQGIQDISWNYWKKPDCQVDWLMEERKAVKKLSFCGLEDKCSFKMHGFHDFILKFWSMLRGLPLPIASACPNSQICVTCLALVGIWVCDPHTTGHKSWRSWAVPLLTFPAACSPIPATINRCPMIAWHPAFQVLQDRSYGP